MFDKTNINSLINQAKKMQEKMQQIQEKIKKIKVVGQSGAGLVKITMDGTHNCKNIKIDPSLLTEDKQMLEDLIISAFNDANRRILETQKREISNISDKTTLPI